MSNDPTLILHWKACHRSYDHRDCKDVRIISLPQTPHALQAKKTIDGIALTIPMDVHLNNDSMAFRVSQIRAIVYHNQLEIGIAEDFNIYQSQRRVGASLVLRLHTHTIHAIERIRAGGPVSFDLHLQADLSRSAPEKDGPMIYQTEPQPHDLIATVNYPKDLWVKLLNETGLGANVVVEIPLPPSPSPDWQPIWKAIATARDGLKYGGDTAWKAAIVECRHALEQWQKLEKEDHGPGWHSPTPPERAARTRQQRLDNIRWDLLQCAHEAAHTPADRWTRDDAVLILATLSSLLAIRNP